MRRPGFKVYVYLVIFHQILVCCNYFSDLDYSLNEAFKTAEEQFSMPPEQQAPTQTFDAAQIPPANSSTVPDDQFDQMEQMLDKLPYK